VSNRAHKKRISPAFMAYYGLAIRINK